MGLGCVEPQLLHQGEVQGLPQLNRSAPGLWSPLPLYLCRLPSPELRSQSTASPAPKLQSLLLFSLLPSCQHNWAILLLLSSFIFKILAKLYHFSLNPPRDPSPLPFKITASFFLLIVVCIFVYVCPDTSLNITCVVCAMLLVWMFPGLTIWN